MGSNTKLSVVARRSSYLSSVAGAIVGALLVREGLDTVLWTGAAISLIAALLTTRLPSATQRVLM
jgi:drug/metabolite transporter (DMT)-like permease